MNINPISSASAFSSGSQLWAFCQPECSFWSRKVDWYLNYQVAQALAQKPLEVHPQAYAIFKGAGYELTPLPSMNSKANILIAPQTTAPASQIIFIYFDHSTEEWLNRVVTAWQNLDKPSLRIFLPEDVSSTACESFFKRYQSSVAGISYVLDYSH